MWNPVDSVINFFSPVAGLKRARARAGIRIYEGASTSRRSSWKARNTSANTELSAALGALRDRSRDLVRNSPHAPRSLEILVSNIVGAGINPVCRTGDGAIDKQVAQLWKDWAEQCDIEGVQPFNSLQALAVRSMIEGGDCCMRLIDQPLRKKRVRTDPDIVPLKLQLLEGDFIDPYRDGVYNTVQGSPVTVARSRLGVGLGEKGEHLGLWLLPYHPGEMSVQLRPGISDFVPMDQLIHLYRPTRAGLVRGVPWFASILTTAREMEDFRDAVNVKARVEACFAAFVLNNDDLGSLLGDVAVDPVTQHQITTLEPGMIKELKAGQDIKFAQPSSTTQVEPMLLQNLMSFAAGTNVTYDQLTSDLRGANYSSLRAGKIDFRRFVEHIQATVVIPILCARVWSNFIDRAILAGFLKDRDGGYPVSWVTPSWEPINPRLDLTAETNAVRSGRTSPQHFIASWGHDWRDVVDQWAAFQQYCDEKGVVLDLDPRYRTQSGVAQTAVTTQAQATAEAADAAGDGVDPTQADGEVDDAQGNPIDPDEQQADARSPKLNGGSHHAP